MRVLVVGAGISGLASAWELSNRGHEVTVLESSSRVGGRIHTVRLNGCDVEAGANFTTSAYREIPRLAAAVGLPRQPVDSSSAILLADGIHPFSAEQPWTVPRSGLLPVKTLLRQVPGLARLAAASRGRGTLDPRDWTALDGLSGAEWAQRSGLSALHQRAWRPAYHGFYFSDSATSSAAALGAMTAHGLWQRTLTYAGGFASLPTRLAERLDVRLNTPVRYVEEHAHGARVHLEHESLEADAVIVATPGPTLASLLDLTPAEAALSSTPYSPGLLALVSTTRRLHPDELGRAYGVLCSPGLGQVAAACVAGRAGHAHEDGDVVTVMFAPVATRALEGQSDGTILAAARAALLDWSPSLAPAFARDELCRVVRIPHAMPETPPGRVEAISRYREAASSRRVVIAGDSHAWPWTDSAAAAGVWAADTLLRAAIRQEPDRRSTSM